jgi:hypothetical protein
MRNMIAGVADDIDRLTAASGLWLPHRLYG